MKDSLPLRYWCALLATLIGCIALAGCAAHDPRTRHSVEGVKMDAGKKSMVAQICEATGAPCKYEGDSMRRIHQGLGITSAEFDAFVPQLMSILNQFKAGDREQHDLLQILASMKTDIAST